MGLLFRNELYSKKVLGVLGLHDSVTIAIFYYFTSLYSNNSSHAQLIWLNFSSPHTYYHRVVVALSSSIHAIFSQSMFHSFIHSFVHSFLHIYSLLFFKSIVIIDVVRIGVYTIYIYIKMMLFSTSTVWLCSCYHRHCCCCYY